LKRDATLAASLLGVDLAEEGYAPPVSDRDDGSDIAGGGEPVSEEEMRRVGRGGGGSLDEYSWDDDASLDKLATVLCKKAVDLPSNARNSARLLRFLKTLTQHICDPMKLDDVAELRRSITAKHNELTAKQKVAQKGKKGGGSTVGVSKKANSVKVASGNSGGRNTYGDELDYDDGGGDDDFM